MALQARSAIPRNKGVLKGTPNRELQEYSMNTIEYQDPGRYIPIILLMDEILHHLGALNYCNL